jgi:hypothetical protein
LGGRWIKYYLYCGFETLKTENLTVLGEKICKAACLEIFSIQNKVKHTLTFVFLDYLNLGELLSYLTGSLLIL